MRLAVLLLLVACWSGFAADQAPVQSPPLSIERLNAPPVTLAQYRGKVVALAFILTSCSHCQDLTKILNRLAPEYAPRGVQFLECAINGDAPTAMKDFVSRFAPQFPVGWNSEAVVRAYVHLPIPRPLYAPHMVFLDRNGAIRMDAPGDNGAFYGNVEASIRAELDQLLKK